MPRESTITPAREHGRFATTRWSAVARAGDPSEPGAREALEELCRNYWPPIFAFALRQSRGFHAAQDSTQAFFARFLERGYLRAADRSRGRFRTFLLTCFQHFLTQEWEKERAVKRGGRFELVSWEEHHAALESRAEAATGLKPETHYDREWALSVMGRALTRLRREFTDAGRERHFALLGRFLQAEPGPGDYQNAARELALDPRAVKLTVHRLRRRYGRLVRDEVRETVTDASDVEDELRHLVEVLSG